MSHSRHPLARAWLCYPLQCAALLGAPCQHVDMHRDHRARLAKLPAAASTRNAAVAALVLLSGLPRRSRSPLRWFKPALLKAVLSFGAYADVVVLVGC